MWWYTRLKTKRSGLTGLVCRLADMGYWLVHNLAAGRRRSLATLDEWKHRYGRKPVPFDEVLATADRCKSVVNPLLIHPSKRVGVGDDLPMAPLNQWLAGRELGAWTLSGDVIEWLHGWVLENKPQRILEFGSGVSTLVLAAAVKQAFPDAKEPVIISLEESEGCAAETRALLAKAGVDGLAQVHVAPAGPLGEGEKTGYQIDASQLRGPYELVVIDGPTTSRRQTLPTAMALTTRPGLFVLDDALRDDELGDLRAWRELQGVTIEGVSVMGKGLAVGHYSPSVGEV